MDILQAHKDVVADYASYIRSFLNIADAAIAEKVHSELSQGKLWPEPLLQFNPAFQIVGKVADLCLEGVLHPDIADIFRSYSLYQHQVAAIKLGKGGKDFIVTSGTGSGKSLTYIGSIFDHILTRPESEGVTAVVVYPMNALINSQSEEFDRYKTNYENATGISFPISFGQYTGQESEAKRKDMRENPPQVLLTNYMMLELLLTRVRERSIRDAIYANLRFLVFDELHTYRVRQGADIAMLIRRIRARAQAPVTCIGTSATMVSADGLASQREQVAAVATTQFGRQFAVDQVITETLARSTRETGVVPPCQQLARAVEAGIDVSGTVDDLKSHPLAAWLENRIALDENDGQLVRRRPLRLSEIVTILAQDTGLPENTCHECVSALLQWINSANKRVLAGGGLYTLLPFKLHQFISQTGSVYTTLDQDENRFITLEPGVYKPDEANSKRIFPKRFQSGYWTSIYLRLNQWESTRATRIS